MQSAFTICMYIGIHLFYMVFHSCYTHLVNKIMGILGIDIYIEESIITISIWLSWYGMKYRACVHVGLYNTCNISCFHFGAWVWCNMFYDQELFFIQKGILQAFILWESICSVRLASGMRISLRSWCQYPIKKLHLLLTPRRRFISLTRANGKCRNMLYS